MNPERPSAYEQLPPAAAARVDAACDRFEGAWRAARSGGAPPLPADFLGCCAEPERTALAGELAALDRACRERYGGAREGPAADEAAPPTYLAPTLPCLPGRRAHWPAIPGLELVEVVGAGGMGVVFKGRQPALDREVAVKFLRDAHIDDPAQRERFKQEARAVARLQHPGLVQLYEFGEAPGVEDAGSRPYLVLEYVSGGSLARRLQDSRLPPREAARLVEALAEAVHYAHRQGVIHRDLKPANVLLAPNPEARPGFADAASSFTPKVADFGLAKFVAGGSLTRTGDVLGTPCYMAPEQTVGKAEAAPAVDVYGLGAILYEALSGRPPFDAETQAATLRQVQEDDPVPPRRLARGVPPDLETICLTCLRKEPGRRYASAQELADDLRRFRSGETIRARPVGTAGRVLGWCRRRPLVAGLLAALAVVFTAGAAGFLWQWRLARQGEAEVQRQQERAEENLQKLRGMVDSLSELGRDLGKDPRQQKAALALLEEVLAFYEKNLPKDAIDPRLREEAARMYGEVANTYHSTGKWRPALGAYRRQAELLSALAKDEPANREHDRRLAVSCRNRGNVLRDLDETVEARAAYQQAAVIQQRFLDESPDDPVLQVALANTLLNRATVLSSPREADEIEDLYRRAVRLDRSAVGADGQSDYYRAELALSLENLGLCLLARGSVQEAKAAIDKALEIHKKLLHVPAQQGYIERYVARNYVSQGRVLAAAGETAGAEQAYKEAAALLSPLVPEASANPYLRMELAAALTQWADLLGQTSRKNEAETLLRQAIGHYQVLKDDFPEDKENSRQLTAAYLTLACRLSDMGRPDDSAEAYRRASEAAPDDPAANNNLAWFLATAAEPRLRRPAEAVRLARKAVDARPESGESWNTLGAAHYRNGDDRAAIASLETSMRLRAGGDGFDWFLLSMAHSRLGDRDEARTWFDRAVGWTTERMPRDDDLRRFRAEAEDLLARAKN